MLAAGAVGLGPCEGAKAWDARRRLGTGTRRRMRTGKVLHVMA